MARKVNSSRHFLIQNGTILCSWSWMAHFKLRPTLKKASIFWFIAVMDGTGLHSCVRWLELYLILFIELLKGLRYWSKKIGFILDISSQCVWAREWMSQDLRKGLRYFYSSWTAYLSCYTNSHRNLSLTTNFWRKLGSRRIQVFSETFYATAKCKWSDTVFQSRQYHCGVSYYRTRSNTWTHITWVLGVF
jgi:hypothetical protein